jgi:phospholipid/cholesterol/gamma-HCH transport system ATP-binding protein
MLNIQGLTKSFDGNHVLRGVDLAIERGDSQVILGGSGSGKSVTLKCIMGFIHPDAGTITLDGDNVVGRHEPAGWHAVSARGVAG